MESSAAAASPCVYHPRRPERTVLYRSEGRWQESEPTLPDGPFAVTGTRNFTEAGRQAIRETLESCGGNRALAARQLGISERSIYNKIKRLEL